MFSLTNIINHLLVYRYLYLFPVSVVEGPIVSIISGFLASTNALNFWLAFLVLIAGDLVGDTLYYLIGHYGRKSFLDRWGHYIGINETKVEQLEKHFVNHGVKTLIIGKITQLPGGAVLVAAGAAKMPYLKFMATNLVATVPKIFALLVVGYYFGRAYQQINRYFNYTSIVVGVLIVVVIIIWLLIRKKRKKN